MSFPYVILHGKMKLYIAIVNVKDLHLHEEIIPNILEYLTQTIKKDGCLKHPVIVDERSLVVLDGMHRVAAIQKLGCDRIPVCLVDYESSAISVSCWCRTIKGAEALEHILTQSEHEGFAVTEAKSSDDVSVGVSPRVVMVKSLEKAFFVQSPFRSVREAYDIIKRIEVGLREAKFEVKYETESDALRKLREHKVDVVLLTPKTSKSAVMEAALSGNVFAHKATRHIIPARVLYVNVPLSLLRNSGRTLSEVNNELRRMLQKRRLRHVTPGNIINGRRYEEDIYIFDYGSARLQNP